MNIKIINDVDMSGNLHLQQVMKAMNDVFQDLYLDREKSPPRTIIQYGSSEMLVSPAAWIRHCVASVKITTITPDNSKLGLPLIHGVVVLTDTKTGQIMALLNGASLTALRTAAVAGLATNLCASLHAGDLAILGAGVQARSTLLSMLMVRQISRVRIFSRSPARTDIFANWARTVTIAEVIICSNVFEAIQGADIICTTTSTNDTVALIKSEWVASGAHVNIIGGTHEEAIEVDPSLLKSAFVVVETTYAAQNEAGEIRAALKHQYINTEDINELGALASGKIMKNKGQTTVFRSVGLAIEDTAAAFAIYQLKKEI